jgi:hypothetical protein
MPYSPREIQRRLDSAQHESSPVQRARILRDLLLEPETLTPQQRFLAESMEEEAAILDSAGY